MDHSEYVIAMKAELVGVARKILSGETSILEGCREIEVLRYEIDDPENSIFYPIRAFESESSHYPTTNRSLFSQDLITRLDNELASLSETMKESIFDSCRKIIELFDVPLLDEQYFG